MTILRNLMPLVALLALGGCGGSSSSTGNTSAANTTTATPTIAVGTTGKAEGIDFTVTSVSTPKQIGAMGIGPKAEAGETFVVVSYTLKNTAAKAIPFTERPNIRLINGKGQTYAPDLPAGIMAAGMMEDPTGMSTDLNPNVLAKTKAAWKVDKAAFDKAAWKLTVTTDPQLTFALK